MTAWPLVLAPFAVLSILALFRFVGCDSLLGLKHFEAKDSYQDTVASDHPVSYWRFQDAHGAEPPAATSPNVPVSGGTAKDETGANDGVFKVVDLMPPPALPDSPSAPGTLALEATGLLDLSGYGANASLSVDGGYVEVAFSTSLLLPSFTIEAIVFPEWSTAETGLYRTVIALSTVDTTPGSTKGFGFGLFAGPADPVNPGGPDVWQIWLGDGTSFLPMKDPARNLTPVDFTKSNYLVVTYDGPTKTLNMFVYVQGIDLDSGVGHPLKSVTVAGFSPVADPTQSLLIGMHRPPVGNTIPVYHSFKGRIQEVAVYREALGIERIMSHVVAGLEI
jgi:hypothetical protein